MQRYFQESCGFHMIMMVQLRRLAIMNICTDCRPPLSLQHQLQGCHSCHLPCPLCQPLFRCTLYSSSCTSSALSLQRSSAISLPTLACATFDICLSRHSPQRCIRGQGRNLHVPSGKQHRRKSVECRWVPSTCQVITLQEQRETAVAAMLENEHRPAFDASLPMSQLCPLSCNSGVRTAGIGQFFPSKC